MKINGHIKKSGKFWEVHLPFLDAMTQGYTRKEALLMAVDLVRCMADDDNFPVTGSYISKTDFVLESDRSAQLISLALKKHRQNQGLSVKAVAKRMGQASPNAYYRFESGKCNPTIGMLERLFRAVGASQHLGIAL